MTASELLSIAEKAVIESPSGVLKMTLDSPGEPRVCKRTSTSVVEMMAPRAFDMPHHTGAAFSFRLARSSCLFVIFACCSFVSALPSAAAAISFPSRKFRRLPARQMVPCSGRQRQCFGTIVESPTVWRLARVAPSQRIATQASSSVKKTRCPAETCVRFAWWPESFALLPRKAVLSTVHTKTFFSVPTVTSMLKRGRYACDSTAPVWQPAPSIFISMLRLLMSQRITERSSEVVVNLFLLMSRYDVTWRL
mmetsp:Transcript_94983/g.245356  ORF Transcript_94983/g.245356 Transcript_94983/m.245356 type:complete len:251 (-) Transcript_94983:1382-2134(-)